MTGHVYKKKSSHGECDPSEDERVIMREGDANSSVTSSESEHRLDLRLGPRTLRQKLDALFHSTKFHILVIAVVILLSLVVITELLIDLQILQFRKEQDFALTRVLYFITVIILGIFLLEMVTKVLVMGPCRFVKHKMEVFDFVIIITSMTLVLALGGEEQSSDGIGFLATLRLWRITKILNGIVASVRAEGQKKLAKERRSRAALEREIRKLKDYCNQQECELDTLRLILRQHGIPEPSVLRLPPTPHTIRVIAEINEYSQQCCNIIQNANSSPGTPPVPAYADALEMRSSTPPTEPPPRFSQDSTSSLFSTDSQQAPETRDDTPKLDSNPL